MIELESSGMFYTGRSIVKQHVDRSSKRHSKRERYREECEENV